jgi:hypothetical protein
MFHRPRASATALGSGRAAPGGINSHTPNDDPYGAGRCETLKRVGDARRS